MTLEEKFYECLDRYFINDDDQFNSACDDLAKLAEKYYVSEVLKPALRADKLEQQLEQQKQFTDTNARIALKFKEELGNQPKLNRQEVEKILTEKLSFEYDEILSRYGVANIDEVITTICNLIVPQQKTLNEQEVINIICDIDMELEERIAAICNLALIDRDKIVEVLKEGNVYSDEPTEKDYEEDVNSLADEIISALGGK